MYVFWHFTKHLGKQHQLSQAVSLFLFLTPRNIGSRKGMVLSTAVLWGHRWVQRKENRIPRPCPSWSNSVLPWILRPWQGWGAGYCKTRLGCNAQGQNCSWSAGSRVRKTWIWVLYLLWQAIHLTSLFPKLSFLSFICSFIYRTNLFICL